MKRGLFVFCFFITLGSLSFAEVNPSELMDKKIEEISSVLKKQYGRPTLTVDLYFDEAGTGKIYVNCTETTAIVCEVYLTVKTEVPNSILNQISARMKTEIPKGVKPTTHKFELQPVVKYDDSHQVKVEKVVLKSVSTGPYKVVIDSKTLEVKSVNAIILE